MPQQRLIGTSTSQVPTNGMLGTLAFMNAANATFPAPVSISLGSAAAPSIAFTGDLNTGIYSPGADQVAISTNGTGRLFVDASGNVGIGATPNSYAGYSTLTINNTTGSELDFEVNGTLTSDIYTDSAGTYWTTRTAVPIVLRTNSIERLRVTSAGLVGLGTSAPAATLHVAGASVNMEYLRVGGSASGRELRFSSSTGSSSGGVVHTINAPGDAGVQGAIRLQTNSITAVTIDSSQRVGIGVNAPDPGGQGLHVHNASAADSSIRITNSTTGATNGDGFAIQVASDGTARLRQFENVALTFETNGTERGRWDSNGRFLVGTSSARSVIARPSVPGASLGTVTPVMQIESAGSSSSDGRAVSITYNNNDVYSSSLVLAKTRGAGVGFTTSVNSGDTLGQINFQGADGTNFIQAADIRVDVDGTPGANDMPGRLVFSTTADGASSPTERMRITSDAYVRLAAGTGGIQFNGDTAAANALDDYEEGTWTPGGITGSEYTYGFYRKVGSLLSLYVSAEHGNGGSISASTITGVPFSTSGAGSWGVSTKDNTLVQTSGAASGSCSVAGTNIIFNTALSSSGPGDGGGRRVRIACICHM